MKYFYVALSETRYIEDVVSLLSECNERFSRARGVRVGVLVRYSKWRRGCAPCKTAERYNVPVFADNGAFEFLTKSDLEREELPLDTLTRWVTDYASWLKSWYNYVTAAALPDIPVHGSEFLPPRLRIARIHLTARLQEMFTRLLARFEPAALSKTVIVIQGFELSEYQLSLHLNTHLAGASETCTLNGGCPYRGVVGVGSVCVRKPSARGKTGRLAEGRAAGTLNEFLREFLDASWPEWLRGFHFFGLHTDAVRRFAEHPRYFASDTGAHGLNFRYKWRTFLKCRAPDKECYLKAIRDQLHRTLSPLLNATLEVVHRAVAATSDARG